MAAFEWLKSLTLAQLERLFAEDKLTKEMLDQSGLADAFWDLQHRLERAADDRVFREALRAQLMREARNAVPEDDQTAE
jgi:hypothetical protein